jgi:hypothetical protein
MLKYLAIAVCVAAELSAQTPLEKRVAELEEKVRRLEALLAAREKPTDSPAPVQRQVQSEPLPDPETRLPVAGYMDFQFNKNRREPGQLDFHRFVLLFGHSFSERIKFWSELELEHAFVEGGEESGEVALEQAYLDFLIHPRFNLRGGMMLTPIGIQNERHEPPSYNGVQRTFVESLIIPTTWREMGVGITGDLGRGVRYRGYVLSALDATRFSAEEGITGGRTNGFAASFRNPAKALRLEYAGLPRTTFGASIYSGHSGFNLVTVNPRVTIFDIDGRFSRGRFDLRGLFARTWISRAGELNRTLERDTGSNPNIAREMRGAYIEPAVHVFPRRARSDLILFTRYEKYNTQHRMPVGFVPLQQFNRHSWLIGATFKPNADVALKIDYSINRSASSVFRPPDTLNLGIGWWF